MSRGVPGTHTGLARVRERVDAGYTEPQDGNQHRRAGTVGRAHTDAGTVINRGLYRWRCADGG